MDLYDDLDDLPMVKKPRSSTTKSPPSSRPIAGASNSTTTGTTTSTSTSTTTTPMVADLQARIQGLEQENEQLKRNMGTLYRTAISELERKQQQIDELQRQQLGSS